MARYLIEHLTRFEYAGPVSESVMELRMRPRESGGQTCERFALAISPQAACGEYLDPFGNLVHYFTLPRRHEALDVRAEATVEVAPAAEASGDGGDWPELVGLRHERSHFNWLAPSHFARTSPQLEAFAAEVVPEKSVRPAPWLSALCDRLHRAIRFAPNQTRADSPIEECLEQRAGVCQDLAHVFITLARREGIPCRYVSGYLFHRENDALESGEDATHAWVEAFVPRAGWIGLDATNAVGVGERHIRVAVGRDYRDVPPTRGVYRGPATVRHEVRVRVQRLPSGEGSPEEKSSMSGLECQLERQALGTVARLGGALGAAEVEHLEQVVGPALHEGAGRMVLELSRLSVLGSAGVGALLKLRRKVENAGGQLVLVAVPEPIRKVLEFSKLSHFFVMVPSVDAAWGQQ